MGIGMCINAYSDDDVDLIVEAFRKVWNQFHVLALL
jgi:hypothetical protein